MATKPMPLSVPRESYDPLDESLFRRSLEDYLLTLSSEVSGIESGSSTLFSLSNKRAMLLGADIGEEIVG